MAFFRLPVPQYLPAADMSHIMLLEYIPQQPTKTKLLRRLMAKTVKKFGFASAGYLLK